MPLQKCFLSFLTKRNRSRAREGGAWVFLYRRIQKSLHSLLSLHAVAGLVVRNALPCGELLRVDCYIGARRPPLPGPRPDLVAASSGIVNVALPVVGAYDSSLVWLGIGCEQYSFRSGEKYRMRYIYPTTCIVSIFSNMLCVPEENSLRPRFCWTPLGPGPHETTEG
jgi:hypothetical protein